MAGFGVAEVTDVRALGGVVLLAGGAVCARMALPQVGRGRTALLLGIALALFVVSHPLGHAIGAWPAVFVSAAAVFAASVLLDG